MSSRPGFLTLPRELRDTIYGLYIFEPDGYHYDYKSNKLRTSSNRPIRLDFMYTCSTIATEMHNLALGSNVINFSTISTDSELAHRFDYAVRGIHAKTSSILEPLREPAMQRFRTPEMDSKLADRFPRLEPLLHQPPLPSSFVSVFAVDMFRSSWGEPASMYRAFQTYMLELVSKDSDFAEALAEFYHGYVRSMDEFEDDASEDRPTEEMIASWNRNSLELSLKESREKADLVRNGILLSGPEAWAIPSEDRVWEIKKILVPDWAKGQVTEDYVSDLARSYELDEAEEARAFRKFFLWKRIQWRFSAAAAAIHFLGKLSDDTLLGIRKIVLHEDRRSVALPESHAQGLIPFCRQNPHIRIERRVSMWRVLLLENRGVGGIDQELNDLYDWDDQGRQEFYDHSRAHELEINACQWITEASALHAYGMPAGSFTLILDGDPVPELASEAFNIVKEDAAWQIAQMQWYADQSLNPDWIATRSGKKRRVLHVQYISASRQRDR